MQERSPSSLLCRVRDVLCALPLEHVEEIMRPLAVDPIAGVPSFVQGLAIIRGAPVPVVDAASLLGGGVSRPTRFVTVKAGERRVALSVDAVVGIVDIPPGSVDALPPLFRDMGPAAVDAIQSVGALDRDLLVVLKSTRLVSDEVWASIRGAGPA